MKVSRNVPPFSPSHSGRYISDNEIMARIANAWAALGAEVRLWLDEPVKTDHGSKMGSVRSDLVNGVPRDG